MVCRVVWFVGGQRVKTRVLVFGPAPVRSRDLRSPARYSLCVVGQVVTRVGTFLELWTGLDNDVRGGLHLQLYGVVVTKGGYCVTVQRGTTIVGLYILRGEKAIYSCAYFCVSFVRFLRGQGHVVGGGTVLTRIFLVVVYRYHNAQQVFPVPRFSGTKGPDVTFYMATISNSGRVVSTLLLFLTTRVQRGFNDGYVYMFVGYENTVLRDFVGVGWCYFCRGQITLWILPCFWVVFRNTCGRRTRPLPFRRGSCH